MNWIKGATFAVSVIVLALSAAPIITGWEGTKYATHDIGQISRQLHPEDSWCLRCGVVSSCKSGWVSVEYGHRRVSYRLLCQECWQSLDLDQRLMYAKAKVRTMQTDRLEDAWDESIKVDENDFVWQRIRERVIKNEVGIW